MLMAISSTLLIESDARHAARVALRSRHARFAPPSRRMHGAAGQATTAARFSLL